MVWTWLKKICIWGGFLLGLLILSLLSLPSDDLRHLEFAKHLLFGGFTHFWESLPFLVPKLPALVGFAILLLGSICGLQALLSKFAKSKRGSEARWRPKWTLALVGLFLAALGTASASIGIAHHATWLAKDGVISYDYSSSPVTKNVGNCRQLVMALKIYSSDHGGQYPKRLEDLERAGVIEQGNLPAINRVISRDGLMVPLIFLTGLSDAAPGDIPLVIGPCPVGRNLYLLGLNDGSASAVTKEEFEAAMVRYRKFVEGKG